ncbi:putative repeat protein (TIGR01451 family) [Thermoflavifilum aggregans]|uniref:Putative repeat protein (TIGR01451 family) n=1 Tax=Thermoflavifilum aggregans TaxID=454188 RepID=A0A2M9CVQ3_9BACT|nr:DUF1573 domain-containing protein [Thermoflavifilum aggregans]PJJ75957.1 putative repeat protein (TIGR01451 family) [Thermoflavifilum aggregans]
MHAYIRMLMVGFTGMWMACGSPAGTPQAENQQLGQAKISWQDTLADLGTIKEGADVTYTFTFKNTGNADLQIQQVIPSCGCTVADVPSVPVHPGQQGHIVIHYHSAGQTGEQTKQITIVSNALPAKQSLYLKARIIQP